MFRFTPTTNTIISLPPGTVIADDKSFTPFQVGKYYDCVIRNNVLYFSVTTK